jgi:PD-(D/E)XK nuclease superfamily
VQEKKSHIVTLALAESSRDAWEHVIARWCARAAPDCWKRTLPAAIVIPTRGHANRLKARLLAQGTSCFGLHFFTPTSLREMLSRDDATPCGEAENLRLLLAIAAAEMPDGLTARAVARSPAPLLRALDRLETAGWKFEQLDLASFLPLVRRFHQLMKQCGFVLPGKMDRFRSQQTAKSGRKFSDILITGFDGAHWANWFLLRTAVELAENATVILDYPSEKISRADELWIGSWEETFGEAQPIATSRSPGDSFFSEAEMRGDTQRINFFVGADASEQAGAIALAALRFLAQRDDARVGIIFAQRGALPRLVGAELTRLGVPHNDGLAHFVPGIFETAEWRAWLELQGSPRIASFLAFFNALTNRSEIFPDLRTPEIENVLRHAHSEVLIDDLEVLREFCSAKNTAVAAAIHSLGQLPASATLAQFLHRTEAALARLGWKQHRIAIASHVGDWVEKIRAEFSRDLFLRWLSEIAATFAIERSENGNHPYAPVQLLTVSQASGQDWSHLIFAGWNDGVWPPPASGEFAREEEIAAFNEKVFQLNQRVARRGRQGEGHISVREGHTFYLGPAERRAIALRQFDALRRAATEEIALTASLVQEGEPERFWNPSELFTQLYLETTQRPLTQNAMRELQAKTRSWLEASSGLTSERKSAAKDVQQTRVAYDRRRDPATKSGEYDFAFTSKPNREPVFSVSEFDRFISAPGLVWMKHYLGVRAVEDDAHIWNTSSGRWIHDWLKHLASGEEKTFSRLPKAAEIDRRVIEAANEKRTQIKALCQRTGKPLPDWWHSGWENALFLARVLGERLSTADAWPWMATEWKLDQEVPAKIDEKTTLAFRGRIDLILAREELPAGALQTDELWIIDYKTGAKKALRLPLKKKLLDGSALQLSLYALAARTQGAQCAHISLLSPLVRPLEPQLSDSDLATELEIFLELARMQQDGAFGMHGPLRGMFRFTEDYPLATLGIDQDTLEQRWEITHPALVRDEEEIFW